MGKTSTFYRDTSYVTPTPAGQNGGDLAGQSMTAMMYSSKYIAVYSVTHNTSYSQYAMCNYISNGNKGNSCIGGGKTIGRIAVFRQCNGKPLCGQCTPNDEEGSWISFP